MQLYEWLSDLEFSYSSSKLLWIEPEKEHIYKQNISENPLSNEIEEISLTIMS